METELIKDLSDIVGKYFAIYGLNELTINLSQFLDIIITEEQKNKRGCNYDKNNVEKNICS